MTKRKDLLICIKSNVKQHALKLLLLPFLSLLLFCYVFVPRLPGAPGAISDFLYKYLELLDPLILVSYFFLPILLLLLIVMSILYFVPKRKHKFLLIILIVTFNLSGVVYSLILSQGALFNLGLRLLTISATPVVKNIENHHDKNGAYPDTLRGMDTGYIGSLSDSSNGMATLKYTRLNQHAYDLSIELSTDRYCRTFIEICLGFSLRYHPHTRLTAGCQGNFAAFYDCVHPISHDWYAVKNIQHF